MKKTLHLISGILFNLFVVIFGFVTVLNLISADPSMKIVFDTYFGAGEQIIESTGSIYYNSSFSSIATERNAARDICIAAESEGCVLLKNENDALPMKEGSVSLYGSSSFAPLYGNGGSGYVAVDGDEPTFKEVFEEAGFSVNADLWNWYAAHPKFVRDLGGKIGSTNNLIADIADASWSEIDTKAKSDNADLGIMVISRFGTESKDLARSKKDGDLVKSDFKNGNYLELSDNEISVLRGMKAEKDAGHIKKILVLFNFANQIQTDFIDNADFGIDACLWMGLPGSSGLYAVADIVKGDVTPSGRLTDLWYTNHCYNPAMANFGDFAYNGKIDGKTKKYVVYQEGVYLGYRYAETRYNDKINNRPDVGDFDYDKTVKYPFGYGLSYTTFEYSDFKVTPPEEEGADVYTVSVNVTNTGHYAGKEAVQIYLQQPYTQYDIDNHIEKPSVELVGFEKTVKLDANESELVEIKVDGSFFASYDAYGAGTYYLDEGRYYLTAAKNSHDAMNNILTAQGIEAGVGNAGLVKYFDLASSAEKYSVSASTGNKISNLFDDVDLNRSDKDNRITYLSRNDWNGTYLQAYDESHNYTDKHVVINATDFVKDGFKYDNNGKVRKDDVKDCVYGKMPESGEPMQLIELRQDKETGDPIAYDDPRWKIFLDQLTREQTEQIVSDGRRKTAGVAEIGKPRTEDFNGSIGFNCWYKIGGNGFASLKNDSNIEKHPTGYPCGGIIAGTFNKKLAYAVGQSIGEDALWAGCSGIYGFGLNLHRTAYHGRNFEAYSEDPVLSGLIGAQQSKGCQDKGCYVYNKHCVLNEQETNRVGHGTYINEQALRQNYLRAFQLAVEVGGAKNVMTSFTRLGSRWSGNHEGLCTGFLRGECGMTGFAVSDWYKSDGMCLAGGILAGNDLPDGATDELKNFRVGYGKLAWAMRESAHRICYTVLHSNAMNGIGEGTRIYFKEAAWVGLFRNLMIGTGVVAGVAMAAYIAVSVLVLIDKRKRR